MFRIIHAIDYKQWLLASTALFHPDFVRKLAASRALIKQAKAQEEELRS